MPVLQRPDEWRPYVQVERDARRGLGYLEVFPALLPEAQSLEAFGEGESCVERVEHTGPASLLEIPQQNGALDHAVEMAAGCLARDYVFEGEIRDDLDEELGR